MDYIHHVLVRLFAVTVQQSPNQVIHVFNSSLYEHFFVAVISVKKVLRQPIRTDNMYINLTYWKALLWAVFVCPVINPYNVVCALL